MTCHSRKCTDVINNFNDGCFPFGCARCILAHWHGLLGHLNGAEPSLVLLVTPVQVSDEEVKSLIRLCQVYMTQKLHMCPQTAGCHMVRTYNFLKSAINYSDSLLCETMQHDDVRLKEL